MKRLHTTEVGNPTTKTEFPRLRISPTTRCIYLMTDSSTGTRLTNGRDTMPVGVHSNTLADLVDYDGSVKLDMR